MRDNRQDARMLRQTQRRAEDARMLRQTQRRADDIMRSRSAPPKPVGRGLQQEGEGTEEGDVGGVGVPQVPLHVLQEEEPGQQVLGKPHNGNCPNGRLPPQLLLLLFLLLQLRPPPTASNTPSHSNTQACRWVGAGRSKRKTHSSGRQGVRVRPRAGEARGSILLSRPGRPRQ